jgi:hypothetical protein
LAACALVTLAASCARGIRDESDDGPRRCPTRCDGECVDIGADPLNCGACGEACGPDASCVMGRCTASDCAPGLVACGEDCVDTSSDERHCGACDEPCEGTEVCQASTCVAGCPTGQVWCDEQCIDSESDAMHCGASGDCMGDNAGAVCAAGQTCVDGTCSCPDGLIACGADCVDPLTDDGFCGASSDCSGANAGVVCILPQSCSGGVCRTPVMLSFDEVGAPTLFNDTAPLTTLYTPQGVTFSGPTAGQGGAILNVSTFSISGHTAPNGLAFNTSTYGIDPETLTFDPPVALVRFAAGGGSGAFSVTAFDSAMVMVDSAAVTVTPAMQNVELSAASISRVVIDGPAVFVVDNLYFEY